MPRPRRTDRRAARVRALARIAALAAVGRAAALVTAFRAAERDGVPLRALRETLLQVLLFAGFPRTVNALEALERALGPRDPDPPERTGGDAALRRRGGALFRRVYGPDADRVLGDIGGRHPELRDWILRDAYGRVLARPGLDAAERECIAVALLAALDLPRQQVAHLRGAGRCGARPAEIRAALDGVRGIAPAAAIRFARERLPDAR
jgi:alkylhydroperoxidase/carboxymuconolactone decarboxylase family protein YurZ